MRFTQPFQVLKSSLIFSKHIVTILKKDDIIACNYTEVFKQMLWNLAKANIELTQTFIKTFEQNL